MTDNGHPLRDGLVGQAPSPDGLGHTATIPDANEDEITKAVREGRFKHLAEMLPPISDLIISYSESVRKAQERYEADCAFLNELMTLASRITHAIVSQGANAFEEQYAKAIEARSGETERLDPQDDSAGRQALPKDTGHA